MEATNLFFKRKSTQVCFNIGLNIHCLVYLLLIFNDRINVKSEGDQDSTQRGIKFSFDQEERHVAFWDFVRDKNWASVGGFIDKKVSIGKLNHQTTILALRLEV